MEIDFRVLGSGIGYGHGYGHGYGNEVSSPTM